MRSYFIVILLFLLPLCIVAQEETKQKIVSENILISNTEFTIENITNIAKSQIPIKEIELYRGNKKLLSHTISYADGDCNSIVVELGKYEIRSDSIIFYSYWALTGDAPVSPYGVRKQIYVVQNDGQLDLINGKIYLEAFKAGWGEGKYKGVDYIYTPPTNKEEKALLAEYKKAIEQEYNASFVVGNRKKRLFKEVRSKLEKEIKAATKGWAEYNSSFGIKK